MQRIEVEKIVITENGMLIVKRGSRHPWQKIMCCRNDVSCGDWCPCFGNPEPHGDIVGLNLCYSYFTARPGKDNLVDLRKSNDYIIGDDGANAMPPSYLLEDNCK